MLSESITNALNSQINAEIYSSYFYFAMSAYTESISLKGAANWLYVQAQEEMTHAIHMYQYVLDRGAAPSLPAIQAPDAEFSDLGDVFNKVLAHEQMVTERINNIATLAMQENDHATYQFIMWYVNEQVEEESNVSELLSKLKMIDNNRGLILNLDQELAARVFANPFPNDAKLGGRATA